MIFALQRVSAMVMAPLVVVHLFVILHAVRGGLTAGEILFRIQANAIWPFFYGLFVIAIAVHAPIGVRTILREWTPLPPRLIDFGMIGFSIVLLLLGARAVIAVTGAAP